MPVRGNEAIGERAAVPTQWFFSEVREVRDPEAELGVYCNFAVFL
ncbi:MAG TPA: hypothetical protein VIV60_36780 [Polyangiaceae bacterium]